MSDRTSAEIFEKLFKHLATLPKTKTRTAVALHAWKDAQGYDFHPMDMDADNELIKLRLARRTGRGDSAEVNYANADGERI